MRLVFGGGWILLLFLVGWIGVGATSLSALGIGRLDSEQLVAAVASLETESGVVSFGVTSKPYYPFVPGCVNAAIAMDDKKKRKNTNQQEHSTPFVIFTGSTGYQVLTADRGTVLEQAIRVNGTEVNYEVVAWSYSDALQKVLIVGWSNGEGRPKTTRRKRRNTDERWVAVEEEKQDNDGPEVNMMDVISGELTLVTPIPGFAFLACNAVSVGGHVLHYAFLDEDREQHSMTLDLNTLAMFPVHVDMEVYGSFMALTASSDAPETLLVFTERNQLWLIQPFSATPTVIRQMDPGQGNKLVVLGAATFLSSTLSFQQTGTAYALLNQEDSVYLAAMNTTDMDIHMTLLTNISATFDLGLFNLAL